MKEAPFAPAITGPIDDPRVNPVDPAELAAALFDEKTRARLARVAETAGTSPLDLIRAAALRYLDEIDRLVPVPETASSEIEPPPPASPE